MGLNNDQYHYLRFISGMWYFVRNMGWHLAVKRTTGVKASLGILGLCCYVLIEGLSL